MIKRIYTDQFGIPITLEEQRACIKLSLEQPTLKQRRQNNLTLFLSMPTARGLVERVEFMSDRVFKDNWEIAPITESFHDYTKYYDLQAQETVRVSMQTVHTYGAFVMIHIKREGYFKKELFNLSQTRAGAFVYDFKNLIGEG